MKSNQIVTFVVNKDLDIANHFIGVNSYRRNKERNFKQQFNERLERLSIIVSDDEIKSEIEKFVSGFYKKEKELISLANDINGEWVKIEKEFIKRLEMIHKFPFPYTSVRGVLSSAGRFGYNTNDGWFATDMLRNKFLCIDTATHELMHFMFHKYYDKICENNGLSNNQMWDVKESFTVLLSHEFSDLRFQPDNGYPPHLKLREIIRNSWEKNRDFNMTLEEAIEYIKNTEIK